MSEPIRVLHVDNDPEFADLTAEFLRRENEAFSVVTVGDPEAARATLAGEPIDCVVSDYELTPVDGIEFLEAVREDHPDLPFILFTGRGSEEVASEAISAGATDYLQKETGTSQYAVLANRIENAVTRHRTRRRSRRQLRRERERFSALFEEFPEPTFAYEYVDNEPIIREVNDAFGGEGDRRAGPRRRVRRSGGAATDCRRPALLLAAEHPALPGGGDRRVRRVHGHPRAQAPRAGPRTEKRAARTVRQHRLPRPAQPAERRQFAAHARPRRLRQRAPGVRRQRPRPDRDDHRGHAHPRQAGRQRRRDESGRPPDGRPALVGERPDRRRRPRDRDGADDPRRCRPPAPRDREPLPQRRRAWLDEPWLAGSPGAPSRAGRAMGTAKGVATGTPPPAFSSPTTAPASPRTATTSSNRVSRRSRTAPASAWRSSGTSRKPTAGTSLRPKARRAARASRLPASTSSSDTVVRDSVPPFCTAKGRKS
ncbi:hypothetical protein BRC69_05435 [Halobacteriales archaeon QH_6_66_25]|nr:MAG: hypothetical protein BRC69_05435 [Halobacteriales archaeon QH_6_66_25]